MNKSFSMRFPEHMNKKQCYEYLGYCKSSFNMFLRENPSFLDCMISKNRFSKIKIDKWNECYTPPQNIDNMADNILAQLKREF